MFSFLNAMPDAHAKVSGNRNYPELEGDVYFYGVHGGTMVVADVRNLPEGNQFHAFHIHEGGDCDNPGQHYAGNQGQHPNHAGDMPPLLANDGNAFQVFYTSRFFPEDVVGKTVVIHEMRDDFKTQPSGDAGEMIACGEIEGKSKISKSYHY